MMAEPTLQEAIEAVQDWARTSIVCGTVESLEKVLRTVLSAAEGAAADRERAACRLQVSRWTLKLVAKWREDAQKERNWKMNDLANVHDYCADELADALAAKTAPDAGQEGEQ